MGAQDQGANATQGRWLVIPRTLCFVLNGEDVLLMKRAANRRVFPNRYNGVGGHIERDEDPATSARREISEETGLIVRDLRLRGIHNINAGESTGIMLFVFTANADSRETIDSDEGTLHWVSYEQALKLDLVEDLALILPNLFGKRDDSAPWFAHVTYDDGDNIRLRYAEENYD